MVRKRKRLQPDVEVAVTSDGDNVQEGSQVVLEDNVNKRAKKRVKRSIKTIENGFDSAEKEIIPPIEWTEKMELRLWEEIYRDIFERVEGRTAVMSTSRSLQWGKTVRAIEDVKDRFVDVLIQIPCFQR